MGKFVGIMGMAGVLVLFVIFLVMSQMVMACSDPSNHNANINTNCNTNKNTNTNTNKNTNVNLNTQQQKQFQGQAQGQLQAQSNEINNSDSITITQGREFIGSGNAEYGKLIGGAPFLHSYGMWTVRQICMYDNRFLMVDVVSALIKEGILREEQVYSEEYMTVVFGKTPVKGLTRIGYVAVMATKEGSSLDALFVAMLKAYKMGGNTIHVVGEGNEKNLKASGWGIGFHGARATIGDNDTSSGVAGGGTGYSSAKTKQEANPWIRCIVLK